MVYFNDRTFAAGRVPIREEVHKVYALPLPVRQTPEPSPPAEPVQVPQWAEGGTVFDWYNPNNNSFGPTLDSVKQTQLKQQHGASWNIDNVPNGTTSSRHGIQRNIEQADSGVPPAGGDKLHQTGVQKGIDTVKNHVQGYNDHPDTVILAGAKGIGKTLLRGIIQGAGRKSHEETEKILSYWGVV